MAVLIGLVLAACSGGDDSSSVSDPPSVTDTTESAGQGATDTSAVPTSTSVAGGVGTDSSVADTTTTTEPPTAVIPLGVRWETVGSIPDAALPSSPRSLVTISGELWMFTGRANSTVVARSRDAGLTWEQVPVVAPPESGAQTVTDVVVGADGRLVARGTIGSTCQVNIDVGDGFREVGLCGRFRPVLYLSDDDGASWRQIEPPVMAPAGDTTVVLEGLVATADGYLAVGTVKGRDWHVRLWSSPDGETWSLDREIRGDGAPISARQLLANGDEVVLLADEHPCASVYYNTPGWYLGAQWVEHLRIYSGATSGDLALLGAADHPFAHDLQPIDCADETERDQVAELNALHTTASGAVIGGVITMLEEVRDVEEAEDADLLTSGTRRIAQLIDGTWVPTEIVGVQSPNKASGSSLIDVGGVPGIMESRSAGQVLRDLVPILPDGDGSRYQAIPEQSVVGSVAAGAWAGGAVVVVGSTLDDPYVTTVDPAENRRTVQVWRSVETTGSAAALCDLRAGGSCRFADLSLVDGYPDFADVDLSGADLSFTDLGDADLSGADFTGAKLWEVTIGEGASVEGANFTGASLPRSEVGNASGATFDGAYLIWSDLADATGSSFAGADLGFASLSFTALPNLTGADLRYSSLEAIPPSDGGPFEITLDGLDLTDADIDTEWDAPRLTITSAVGAILDGTSFKNSDLSLLDPAVVDLTDADVWDDSICPDGLPPDDPPIGTCIRGVTP